MTWILPSTSPMLPDENPLVWSPRVEIRTDRLTKVQAFAIYALVILVGAVVAVLLSPKNPWVQALTVICIVAYGLGMELIRRKPVPDPLAGIDGQLLAILWQTHPETKDQCAQALENMAATSVDVERRAKLSHLARAVRGQMPLP
jgi:hypothetical protein